MYDSNIYELFNFGGNGPAVFPVSITDSSFERGSHHALVVTGPPGQDLTNTMNVFVMRNVTFSDTFMYHQTAQMYLQGYSLSGTLAKVDLADYDVVS